MQTDGNLVLYTYQMETNCQKMSNNNMGGGVGANAVYSFQQTSIPKNMGYLPVEVQAFNKNTGEYISSSQSSLLTQQQKRMYDLFQQKPQASSFFGFNINQSTKLPTEFVLKGSTQPMEYHKPDYFNLLGKPSGSAYEAATRMSPFTKEEADLITYKENPLGFVQEKGYGYTEEGKEVSLKKFQIGTIVSKIDDKSKDYLIVDISPKKIGNVFYIDYHISEVLTIGDIIRYGANQKVSENEICFSRNSRIDDILDNCKTQYDEKNNRFNNRKEK
jgi:hypothetical protein